MEGYYINLESRTDRNEHMKRITSHSFFKNIKRMDAIPHTNGAIGCSLSHIKGLKQLYMLKHKYYMVLEDDFCILNENNFYQFITEFLKIKENDIWDVIVLTPRGITTTKDIQGDFHRIIENQTTTGYIIKHSFIEQLLPIYENSISKLENGGDPNKWALDSCWKPIQKIANFWYFKYIYAGQLPCYSDIEKRVVDYNQRFLLQPNY